MPSELFADTVPRVPSALPRRRASSSSCFPILALTLGILLLSKPQSSAFAQQQQVQSDREILTLLYNTCNGPQWNNAENWLDGSTSICDWHGIQCSDDINKDEDSVTEITLKDNNLDCTLPPEIFYMSHLQTLDLGHNPALTVDFTSIENPAAAGVSLQYLRLNDCGLTSLAGVENAAGIKLSSLDVRGNSIDGVFPTGIMSRYKRLRNLDLSYNFMHGPLPSELGTKLFRLRSLLLADNFFTEKIPNSIGNATKLQILDLSDNAFSSTLPSELGSLKKLSLLTLRNQRIIDEGITGPLFDFKGLKKIEFLDLSGNGLSGTVPESFLASAKTQSPFMSVDVSGNKLVGTLPPSLSRFQMLRVYLIDNMIDDIAPELCGKDFWFFGEVRQFGCNAILCPRGTYNQWGRQISDAFPCLPCPGGAPNLGCTVCARDEEDGEDISGRGNDGRGSNSVPSNDVQNDGRGSNSVPSNDEEDNEENIENAGEENDGSRPPVVMAAVGNLHSTLHNGASPHDPQDLPFVREGRSWLPDNSYLHTQRTSKETEFDYSFVENKHRAGAERRMLRGPSHE